MLARERRPDLVLMDIRLAGPMDGIAVAEQIRRDCDIPVIYLTAHSDGDTLERAKRAPHPATCASPSTNGKWKSASRWRASIRRNPCCGGAS